MKFIDFFAGIGGFHSGLTRAGHEMVGWVEWDKYARQAYQAMYDTKGTYTANDITKIKSGRDIPDAEIWAFGSPCTNISVAGNRKGLGGEQSRLFFEIIRLLEDRDWKEKPSLLLMENVKNLLSSNRGWDFARVIAEMDQAGYDVEWEVLNSSWVIPQNRERIYIIGHKRGIATSPVFPINRSELEKKRNFGILRDVLEPAVDSKYYLSKDKVKQLLLNGKKITYSGLSNIKIIGNTSKTGHSSQDVVDVQGISKTITATEYKHTTQIAIKVNQVGNISNSKSFGGNPQTGRVYSDRGLSPTLNTMQGGSREPKILVEPCLTPDRVNKRQNGRRFKDNDEPIFTITTADRHGVLLSNGKTYAIRKLTPLECWRLQGFTDEQFNKAKEAGVSNSQLYKQAGNAVTVPIVEVIGKKLKIE
ncbi:DNA cytosine methyltransferase [Limosilactobacillus reuteri]|uniref:DNA (cytosine-5-)-methyltransferase n=1 Tax=Limosilactobacillus reuteri TaxID=1598 RepID=UPI001E2AEA17|nr:DNA (cytosine-5-)-methyltransferase [Limosilactobacillus reuteri]MCC4370521.1 DNA cytosine methyltransferase [Limosilactobacillus reuteri]MCC4509424.1 DNA cytosine methyltransferase [Limosilactobacillus reuteri]